MKNHKTTTQIEQLENSIIMQEKLLIQKRINFLQNSLLQLSFNNKSKYDYFERPDIFKNLITSLSKAKKLLKANSRIQSNMHLQDI
jgi:hypothetical protein